MCRLFFIIIIRNKCRRWEINTKKYYYLQVTWVCTYKLFYELFANNISLLKSNQPMQITWVCAIVSWGTNTSSRGVGSCSINMYFTTTKHPGKQRKLEEQKKKNPDSPISHSCAFHNKKNEIFIHKILSRIHILTKMEMNIEEN